MLLSVFTRHSAGCKFSRDRACRRCNCPKWVGGQINGYYFRQSAKTRQWAEADAVRQQLEEALAKGQPPFGSAMATAESSRSETAAPTTPPAPSTETPAVPSHEIRPKPRPRVTVAQAVDAYLADAVSRSVEASTLKKLETIFRKQFLAWTRVQGFEYLDELDLDALLSFRNTWEDGPLAKQKKQSRVIGFFWACVRRRYLTENPAIGLGKIKVVQVPTDYFPPEEFERIVASTYIRRGERGGGDVKANQARLRTMTLLMRWSGLRIRDAVTLERHRLHGDSLLLYQAKTGTPVYVPLPPHVVELLEDVPPGPKPNPRYFFWSGNGDPQTDSGLALSNLSGLAPGTRSIMNQSRRLWTPNEPGRGLWKLDFSVPMDQWKNDYAIIAREDDASIGVPVLVIAGLGNFGTIAASEVIASDTLAQKLTSDGSCKGKPNFEAVIGTDISGAHAGPPRVLRQTCWQLNGNAVHAETCQPCLCRNDHCSL